MYNKWRRQWRRIQLGICTFQCSNVFPYYFTTALQTRCFPVIILAVSSKSTLAEPTQPILPHMLMYTDQDMDRWWQTIHTERASWSCPAALSAVAVPVPAQPAAEDWVRSDEITRGSGLPSLGQYGSGLWGRKEIAREDPEHGRCNKS